MEEKIFIPLQIEGDITIDRFQSGSMFQGCSRMTSLTVLEGALPEGTDFSGCSSLRTLKVGKDHIKDQNVQEAVQKYKLKLEYFEEKVNFIRVLLPLLIMTVIHVLYYLYFRGGEVKPHFLLLLGLFVLDVIGFGVMCKEDKANIGKRSVVTLCEIVYVLLFICSLVFTIMIGIGGIHPLAFILLIAAVVFGVGMLLF